MSRARAVAAAAAVALAAPAAGAEERVRLTGGCFTLGETRVYPEEGPAREVCIAPFAIASHEVTTAEFAAFVDATGYVTRAEKGWTDDDPDGPGVAIPPSSAVFQPGAGGARWGDWWRLVPGASWRRPEGPDGRRAEPDHPVVHVTRADAAAYAAWAGGRLPSEAEWEFAARAGRDGELMAWDEAQAEARQQANTWQGVFPVLDTGEDGHRGVAPVGRYPANAFGLYDMIGNVWEWTNAAYHPSHDPRPEADADGFDPDQPGVAVGVIKGGSHLCSRSFCFRYRPAARQAQDLMFATSHIGFRVAWDADERADAGRR